MKQMTWAAGRGFKKHERATRKAEFLSWMEGLLPRSKFCAVLFAQQGELLLAQGVKLSGGTIVDATLSAAPPSTKNAKKSRDPKLHQARKGNEWHSGMKLHVGTESQTVLVLGASVLDGLHLEHGHA